MTWIVFSHVTLFNDCLIASTKEMMLRFNTATALHVMKALSSQYLREGIRQTVVYDRGSHRHLKRGFLESIIGTVLFFSQFACCRCGL